ncbi:hypothetical protein HPB48_010590 [Haemaphysalis longicornis]|uniref:SGF29 C-terminal domain-containing protein n=1 Tax=Haemaphysalis longicornis TaxID=44386 RepID=A0A9J6H3B8_HAELO|nr:hypothetical protein HPB48_010590 [Haemaphysalis longicornis]
MQKEADNVAIQEKLRELTHVIQQCQVSIIIVITLFTLTRQEERSRSEHNLSNIGKTHERIQQEQKLSPYYKSKLRGQYKTALQDAESEEELLRKALDLIFDVRAIRNDRRIAAKNSGSVGRRSTSFSDRPKEALRRGALMKMLQQNALTLPLFIGKEDEKPPPLCGAIPAEPNYVAKPTGGCMVAALARGPDDDENWILAEVLHYSHGSAKYEVDDIDEEQKERHTSAGAGWCPCPCSGPTRSPTTGALFPKGTLVMALYPQTTCFYRALVHEPPGGPQDDYLVLFETPPTRRDTRLRWPWRSVGDMVAALARGPDDDENWILAEVLHYSHGSAKYEVDDIDEEQKERHTLSRRRVVPLPLQRANPLTDPGALFPKGTLVMALYPQTTCFYRALVHEPPGGPQDDYLVLFEDSSYPEGYSPPLAVAQRYVICCKEMRKK